MPLRNGISSTGTSNKGTLVPSAYPIFVKRPLFGNSAYRTGLIILILRQCGNLRPESETSLRSSLEAVSEARSEIRLSRRRLFGLRINNKVLRLLPTWGLGLD